MFNILITLATEKRFLKKETISITHTRTLYIISYFHPAPLNARTSLNNANMYYLTDR